MIYRLFFFVALETVEHWINHFMKKHTFYEKTNLIFSWKGNIITRQKQKNLFVHCKTKKI